MNESKVNSVSEKELLNEMKQEGNDNYGNEFFSNEEMLLNHLLTLEKKEAQLLLRSMIENILKYDGDMLTVKYYFITLSGLVARSYKTNVLTPSNTFAFNNSCIALIERTLNEGNLFELADELIEFYIYVLSEKTRPILSHGTVTNVIHYINDEVKAPLTVEGIAKKFGVSTSHLSRTFREHTEVTLIEYINIRKVEESQYYLRFSEKSISEVSNQFNFCNQSYFTRIFKKYTGETPRRFRSNLAGEYFHFIFLEQGK
ncbi:AraC family transcriptional regulator [Sporosarcina sp. G11-34]|uniref:AraC family transcriptional regulator n=1 Tax=Sporosarcina sp. G11-34 TaxID=2849605 RepID=UPI0022A970A4|nr:AraC family transcriptional regulator [Sporosarcina sp. G11-34]MCZ2260400.1 AraC family transcriptional regulator [Sporosarcina sp. G11-34]